MACVEETMNTNILPTVTDDVKFRNETCVGQTELEMGLEDNLNEYETINEEGDLIIKMEGDSAEPCLEIETDEEENQDNPVDYSLQGMNKDKRSSKSEQYGKDMTNIPNKPMAPFSPFMPSSGLQLQAIPFSGGILYQGIDPSHFVSPLLHNLTSDGKPIRPFKAYNTARDLLSGLPPLAGYPIPGGGNVHGSSIRRNTAKSSQVSHAKSNGTPVSSVSTHLMTLATEADKLRQRDCDSDDNIDDDITDDGMTSDGNDSYKEEFYPQGMLSPSGEGTEKRKGKKRKNSSLDDQMKDNTYWERRRKNNEAAKRSRDARRAKEDQIAIRAALLEQENMRLRIELAALKEEMIKLRSSVYGKNENSGKAS